jgi:hypothetical protein
LDKGPARRSRIQHSMDWMRQWQRCLRPVSYRRVSHTVKRLRDSGGILVTRIGHGTVKRAMSLRNQKGRQCGL